MLVLALLALGALPALAQLPTCSTPAWTTCDLAFELQAGENPASVELRAEFRSPRNRTYALTAFHDSGARWVIRFAPTEAGEWEYRVISNVKRLDGQLGRVAASQTDSAGFIHVANVHHFATGVAGENQKPHLWMGAALDNFVKLPRAEFDAIVEQRAKEKFTHLRVRLEADADLCEAAERVRAINAHGLIADLVLASIPQDRAQRERYLNDLVPRFAAMNVTWMGVPAFENVDHAKAVLTDAGALIAKLDPYDHPRTSMAEATSAPLIADKPGGQWLSFLSYGTPSPDIGAVEHQLYQLPAVNTGIRSARDLWNATMNGQYPDSGEGAYMTGWYNFMSGNRYWELEPYFDVDGGRAVALDGIEYIVYVEKPGPVEVTVENHGYNVAWINPQTGERVKAKDYKGQHFTGEPPDKSHEWVLHISREGTKEGMLKSYKFESHRVPVQELEATPDKVPFDVGTPPEGNISAAAPPLYSLKIRRESRATRSLLVEWTAEVAVDGEGYRVVGAGREGTLHIPTSIAHGMPAVVSVRVGILNANGKAYAIDKVYRLVP
jgi:hypothetical protein